MRCFAPEWVRQIPFINVAVCMNELGPRPLTARPANGAVRRMGKIAQGEGLGVEPAELGIAEAVPRIRGAKTLHRGNLAANRPGLGAADFAALAGMANVPVGLPEFPAPALPLHRRAT